MISTHKTSKRHLEALFVLFILFLAAGIEPAEGQGASGAELVGLAGKCVDVLGGDSEDRTPVVLFRCNDQVNQKWTLPERGTTGPVVGIGGKCLDVDGASTANRTPIQIFACHGGDNQQWRHERNGQLVGLGGKCLDVADASSEDRSPLILFECHGDANQRWRPRTPNRWTPVWPSGEEENVPFRGMHANPVDADHVVVASEERMLETVDGGTSWLQMPALPNESFPRAVEFSPDGADLWIGGLDFNGRPAIFHRPSNGGPWDHSTLGSEVGIVTDVSVSPADTSRIVAVVESWDGGIFHTTDGGATWSRTLNASHLKTVARSPSDPNRLYASGWDCVFRSDNGGATWRAVSYFAFEHVEADHSSVGIAFGTSGSSVYRTRNGGDDWVAVSRGSGQIGSVSSLATSSDGRLLYGTTAGQVFLSYDEGDSWVQLETGGSSGVISAATFDPTDPERVWTGVDGRLQLGDWTLAPVSGQALELGSGRFVAELSWRDFAGNTGEGYPVALTQDTGYFWFFSGNNVEVVVKVLDATTVNGFHWVFYGSLSSVEYTLCITDTLTGQVRTYENPLGQLGSGSDTEAF